MAAPLWDVSIATSNYAPFGAGQILAAMEEIQSKMRESQRPIDAIFTTPTGRDMLAASFRRHRFEELRGGTDFGMVPLSAIPITTFPDVVSCFNAADDLTKKGKRVAILTGDGQWFDSLNDPEMFAGFEIADRCLYGKRKS